ncbi:hypothetical protein PtA15_9A700 [Puccinia triticina]|uniref:Autophagy-related protein 16 domain-containing protein n=1 Tax=Puccinia triticina TaxID=208348 RepID=A0ABY7CW49_9BASI|nr:uncharacterized protein PtA15_9A700 [Puccinia triticina]WAQ88573.1 hypothetical protein PtA15_9A700 [Puccinia triticina]
MAGGMEDELQRLWQLLAELSSQLTQNREQTEQLKKQADELKTQAIHTGTGYALKRFNVDLSKEQFESEVERMNAQLVIENQTLQHENRNLTILLKDHETTLEQIMTRFRNHAHSTQLHELELTKYYESLAIQNISILIQKAMRELSGEEPYLNEVDELESQQAIIDSELATASPTDPAAPIPVAFQDPFKPPPPTLSQTRRKSTSVIDYRPRIRDPSSGGYVGRRNGSLSDYALLSAIETERLRRENDYLREMTKLSNVVSEVIKEEDEAADDQHQLSQDSDNPGQPDHQKQIDGWTALIHHDPQPPPDQTLPADQQTQQDQP